MQQLAKDFWNIRAPQRVAGIINVGTHMSVVRRPNGRFVVVDGAPLGKSQREALLQLTAGGSEVEAVVHVHPFHTLHVEATHRLFPSALLYGTLRHRHVAPSLPWAEAPVELWDHVHHPLQDVFDLSVPDGVDFVCLDERVHVASVLVRHRASAIVHVDDTLNVMAAPGVLGRVLPQSGLRMHPMLGRALGAHAGAADAYACWARGLAADWADTRIVCAAHSAVRELEPGGFSREVLHALERVQRTLDRHRKRHG